MAIFAAPLGLISTRRKLAVALALLLTSGLTLSGCSQLPPLAGRTASTYLTGTDDSTALGTAVAPLTAAHPGQSGVYAMPAGADAFAARVMLANAAQRSLDVQYYIWNNDITGMLLFNALRAAAERGVRVRLLLDDNNTAGLDPVLTQLSATPNIEIRLFNPFPMRSLRALGYLTDFSRLNRRMHNKSFTADNEATIVGGRNIGDEYFGAAGEVLFSDLDVVAIGPAVGAVSREFDRYWNSDSAYPLASLVPGPPPADAAARFQAEVAEVSQRPAGRAYLDALRVSPFVKKLVARELPLDWAVARLVSDDPAKVLGKAPARTRVISKLEAMLGAPATSVDLVSPYFVPGKEGAEAFEAMARRGVKVRILTNSFAATDVALVHAGYVKWRKPLLASGVQLYEMRRSWAKGEGGERGGPLGSSAASLHAKTFAVDGKRIFVGSFNFDQRSADLNTEMGFVIDSPALAQRLTAGLSERLPTRAYEVRLAPDRSLYWIERDDQGKQVRYDTEPETSVFTRAGVSVMSVLPIDWLL